MNTLTSEKELFIQTYNRIPIEISHGEGVWLYDIHGKKYLDFFTGLAVNALGHAHPRITEAVTKQIVRFAHLSNNYVTDIQVEFTRLLLKHSGMSKAFLTNSGTESVEGALKLIRKKYGPDKIIYSLSGAFHGRTYGALSMTHKEKYQKGFGPLLQGTGMIRQNDINDLRSKANEKCAAVILEFIQGEGGINEISPDFVAELAALRDQYGFAVISDCIQCGIGRTGKPFSHNYYDIKPDVIVAAKAMGGGLPLGAFMVTEELADVLTTGVHGTTFGGNSVSCAAGKVVLEEVFENGLMQKVADLGDYFKAGLITIAARFPHKVKSVRGKGFMLGLELTFPGAEVVNKMFTKGILTNCTADKVIRILPPLIAGKEEINYYLISLNETLNEVG